MWLLSGMNADEVWKEWKRQEAKLKRNVELAGCASLIRLDVADRFGFEKFDAKSLWTCRHVFEWCRRWFRKWYEQPWTDDAAEDVAIDEMLHRLDVLFADAGLVFGDERSKHLMRVIPMQWPDPMMFSSSLVSR